MMPASNNGVGMNIGFPDVCLTPPPPPVGPIPIPYPNLGQNVMSSVFSPNIFTGFMPALNMASIIPMTMGDNAGVLHPLFMQMGGQTMGNPIVFVNCIPAKNLLVPTFGNAFNNPVGAVLVPSVTTTLYTDGEASRARGAALDAASARVLADAIHGTDVEVADEGDGAWRLTLRRFGTDIARRVHNTLRDLDVQHLTIDLRGNPGGDAAAALELADDFVAEGTPLAQCVEGGDATLIEARFPQSYTFEVTIWVDQGTASAAELFAGALQSCGRAKLIGSRTRGKASAQKICANRDGEGFTYASVAEFRLPNGTPIHDVGLTPSS